MRDWSALVHHHLAAMRIDARRRREMGDELAGHLEDAYLGALRRGCTDSEAMACAMARVPDWAALATAMEDTTTEDAIMTRQARTVLVPGTTMLLTAASGLALALYSTPAVRWLDPRWQDHALAAGLYVVVYLVLGASGAAWSRRVGGSGGERLAAGAFPLALHVAIAGPAAAADVLYALSHGAGGRHLIDMSTMMLVMFALPGAALLLGVLPFTRRQVRRADP